MDLTTLKPFVELGAVAVLALGLLGLVRDLGKKMLAQQAAKDIAQRAVDAEWRKALLENQTQMTTAFGNHLSSIDRNQEKIARTLDLISERLLDAVISKP